MACLPPFWVPLSMFGAQVEGNSDEGGGDDAALATSRAQNLQRMMVCACLAQASAAVCEFAFDDPLNGLIGAGIATLGLQSATPQGFRYIPSYIVLAFCNGSMQVLMGLETTLGSHRILPLLGGSFSAKVASLLSLASPALMYVGIAIAWNLRIELRRMPQPVAPIEGQAAPEDAPVLRDGTHAASSFPGFRPFSGEAHRLEYGRK